MEFFDRDLSWLSFNERVLAEAGNRNVPLLERIKFLSIFSSNLDEFYRVRVPVIRSLKKAGNSKPHDIAAHAIQMMTAQQEYFGRVLSLELLPALRKKNIHLLYGEAIPGNIRPALEEYFFSALAAFLQIKNLSENDPPFFSENNQLYQVVQLQKENGRKLLKIIVVPSGQLPRFFSVYSEGVQYVVFIEDIIRLFLPSIFPGDIVKGIFNIKITRDAELDLEDEFAGDLAEKIESKIAKRDEGYATRFLYEPGIPLRILHWLVSNLQLSGANIVEGGKYHNLKDFAALPISDPTLAYPAWPAVQHRFFIGQSLFGSLALKDRIIHTPYESYNTILRFFNEAAIDPEVTEIFVTLYRIANDSKVANALVTASGNGKKVTVFVELKARFDEANNIRWGKKMKAAGIRIIYSIPKLKVHAKVALVKKNQERKTACFGLLSTGNLNESTARFYTDHILLTTHPGMLRELEMLFVFLSQKRKPIHADEISFKHLLVAQFNLQSGFLRLIEQEIIYAKQGKAATITIKLNNLEEKTMVSKLYEASQAGVKVQLIIRSICCLKPGQPGVSDRIHLTRIVDRYLEHGRIFIFNNDGKELFFLGSADWMNRNIYSRVEVCFPVYDTDIQDELRKIVALQLADNIQAVMINDRLQNIPVRNEGRPVRSQEEIYRFISSGI